MPRKIALLPAAALVLASMASTTAAHADIDYNNHTSVRINAQMATYGDNCLEMNNNDRPYSHEGRDGKLTKGSTSTSFELREANTDNLAASFTSANTFKRTYAKTSPYGFINRMDFDGQVNVNVADSSVCTGAGVVNLETDKLFRAVKAGDLRIKASMKDFYSYGLLVRAYKSTSDPSPRVLLDNRGMYEYNADGVSRKPLNIDRNFKVNAGEYVQITFDSGVFGQYNSDGRVEAGMGGVDSSFTYTPFGAQTQLTSSSVAKKLSVPSSMGCASTKYTFGVKKPKSVKNVSIYANGKKVKAFKKPSKKHVVKFSKSKDVKVKIVVKPKKGKKYQVSKTYNGCR